MHAADLVQLITKARAKVEATVSTYGHDPQSSRALHDVALASTIFGYLPPIRTACIWSMLHPGYKGPCLHSDCTSAQCQGNKLVITSTQPLQMHMHLPHHKNEGAWEKEAIFFQLPHELAVLLHNYIKSGHKELCQHHLMAGSPPTPFVFMGNSGQGFNTSSLNKYWQEWVRDQGGVPHLSGTSLWMKGGLMTWWRVLKTRGQPWLWGTVQQCGTSITTSRKTFIPRSARGL